MKERETFGSRLGFILVSAGCAIGLGNVWKFPYMTGKYGGAAFVLIYLVFLVVLGLPILVSEFAVGRASRKSTAKAFHELEPEGSNFHKYSYMGMIGNYVLMMFYTMVAGWTLYYGYVMATGKLQGADSAQITEFFGNFQKSTGTMTFWMVLAVFLAFGICSLGLQNGVERITKVMMLCLLGLIVVLAVHSATLDGAVEGIKFYLIPNFENFSWMTVVTAMGQMFYSLSIAMGILITFGSYMKKEVSIEESTKNVEIFDTAIAMMAGLMIIPAVFAFSGGNPETLQAGPSLMFITIPKVFDSMGLGTGVGILFFVLVLFAAITSSIALTESAVSTFEDELGWERRKATVIVGIVMLLLGSLSTLGYGPLANVKIIGMQILDFFDFLTNSVMMPIAAIATCLLVSRVMGVQRIEEEVTRGGSPFRRKKIFTVMIKYLCPIFAAIILISSIANAFGWIQM